MLPLLVWLSGVVFGCWLIWHWGFTREAWAFVTCASVMMWIIGGAAWIGQKLQQGAAARGADGKYAQPGRMPGLSPSDREALKKAAASQSGE
jgi:hypothetical protein